MAISAQKFLDSLASHLEKNQLIERYTGVEFKAINTVDNTDFAIYKVARPTLNNQPKNSVPKEEQERGTAEERKAVELDRAGRGTIGTVGTKRKERTGGTPDTGTKGDNSHRYKAISEAVKIGGIKGSIASIKGFKIEGIGCGTKTAQDFRRQLIKDEILKK